MKNLFLCLALLNLVDGIISYIGLKGSFMEEGNPLMNEVYRVSPILFLGIKLLLSFILILVVVYDKIPRLKWVTVLTYIISVIYFITFFLHGVWMIQSILQ
ncbi:hypothetical protein FGG79_15255 [Bacillus sp. BHET2]|uniref:DUF5658 family protein n=1 Tax=Bacillus sp. BHET2 TaxID=2583818 RepID=UPI00110F4ACE|nr:DUF5658 family protein [Bacillus sp. BHET2]TMU84252.1 hypothetical protein FGG79_15255 [Bacillus sp. BHET2]